MQEQVTETGGNSFERFMAGRYGRVMRAAFGVAIIAIGLALVGKPAGYVVAAMGLVPILAGVVGLCPVAPLWGGHLIGSKYCGTPRK